MIQEAYGIMTGLSKRYTERDEHQIFGELIAAKIRNLKTHYARSIVQHRIQNILYEAEQGLYDIPQNTLPPSSGNAGCDVHVSDDNWQLTEL